MNFFKHMKDGGKESKVDGYFLVEIKSLFSIVLLHFSDGSREAFHSHAFNAVSWVLRGKLVENILNDAWTHGANLLGMCFAVHLPDLIPIYTPRSRWHKVVSRGNTWVLSFRGPWENTWKEYLPLQQKVITLTHGRKMVNQ